GGLRLDSGESLRRGGDDGPVVKAGDPDNSLLIQAIRQTGDLKMPPKKRLPAEAIETLAIWIKNGAVWPQTAAAGSDAANWKSHWAFQPIRDPAPPAVRDTAWPKTPIDRFIKARLEGKGLTPSPV